MSGRTQPDAGAAHDRFARKADKRVGVPLSPLCAKTGREHMQQTALLFDHLVGAGEQRRRHGEAERLGGLEVDDEIELGRLLNREVSRLGSAQNLVNNLCCTSEQVWAPPWLMWWQVPNRTGAWRPTAWLGM